MRCLRQGWLAAALVPLLAGCPDPSIYGTPRTLEPGDLQVQASMGGFGGTTAGATHVNAGLPSIGARYGVADRFDVGVRLVDLVAIGGDAKWNFVRGRFDLALDPMVQAFYLPYSAVTSNEAVGVFQFHVPLLLGWNFDEGMTLLMSPGMEATVTTGSALGEDQSLKASVSSGIGPRMGIGLNVRTSDTFSWQPEVTAWHDFNALDSWVYVIGVGINLGAQPNYSDLDGRDN